MCFYWSCYRELQFSPKGAAGVTLRWRGRQKWEGEAAKVHSAVLQAAVTLSGVL